MSAETEPADAKVKLDPDPDKTVTSPTMALNVMDSSNQIQCTIGVRSQGFMTVSHVDPIDGSEYHGILMMASTNPSNSPLIDPTQLEHWQSSISREHKIRDAIQQGKNPRDVLAADPSASKKDQLLFRDKLSASACRQTSLLGQNMHHRITASADRTLRLRPSFGNVLCAKCKHPMNNNKDKFARKQEKQQLGQSVSSGNSNNGACSPSMLTSSDGSSSGKASSPPKAGSADRQVGKGQNGNGKPVILGKRPLFEKSISSCSSKSRPPDTGPSNGLLVTARMKSTAARSIDTPIVARAIRSRPPRKPDLSDVPDGSPVRLGQLPSAIKIFPRVTAPLATTTNDTRSFVSVSNSGQPTTSLPPPPLQRIPQRIAPKPIDYGGANKMDMSAGSSSGGTAIVQAGRPLDLGATSSFSGLSSSSTEQTGFKPLVTSTPAANLVHRTKLIAQKARTISKISRPTVSIRTPTTHSTSHFMPIMSSTPCSSSSPTVSSPTAVPPGIPRLTLSVSRPNHSKPLILKLSKLQSPRPSSETLSSPTVRPANQDTTTKPVQMHHKQRSTSRSQSDSRSSSVADEGEQRRAPAGLIVERTDNPRSITPSPEDNPHGLKPNDVVWAKMPSEPYWPAQVYCFNTGGEACVLWLGSDQHGFVHVSTLEKFTDSFSRRYNPKRENRHGYQSAVVQAIRTNMKNIGDTDLTFCRDKLRLNPKSYTQVTGEKAPSKKETKSKKKKGATRAAPTAARRYRQKPSAQVHALPARPPRSRKSKKQSICEDDEPATTEDCSFNGQAAETSGSSVQRDTESPTDGLVMDLDANADSDDNTQPVLLRQTSNSRSTLVIEESSDHVQDELDDEEETRMDEDNVEEDQTPVNEEHKPPDFDALMSDLKGFSQMDSNPVTTS